MVNYVDYPITFQCNNNCISCIFDTRQMRFIGDTWLPHLKEIVDQQENEECVAFTGGEPTLSDDLFEILSYSRKKWPKKFIFLVSNGRKFADRKYAEEFAGLNLGDFSIGIPLFSHNQKVHDEICGAKNAWAEAVEGTKNLLSLGIRVEIRVIVNKMNYLELEKTAKFILENLAGAFRVVFINMKYTGNAFINRKRLFIRYSKVVPSVQKAADMLEKEFEVKLFHFPLCILDEKYWHMASGTTKQDIELAFSKNCTGCVERDYCARIWISYLPLAGESEFKAIKPK